MDYFSQKINEIRCKWNLLRLLDLNSRALAKNNGTKADRKHKPRFWPSITSTTVWSCRKVFVLLMYILRCGLTFPISSIHLLVSKCSSTLCVGYYWKHLFKSGQINYFMQKFRINWCCCSVKGIVFSNDSLAFHVCNAIYSENFIVALQQRFLRFYQ